MKTIPLAKGFEAIVDDRDFESLSKFKWFTQSKGYAARMEGREMVLMHRQIICANPDQQTDHRNRNKLDNQRHNLRACNNSLNQLNQPIDKTNKTGFKGVCFDSENQKFVAAIQINKKRKFLGRFYTAEEASNAYQKAFEIITIEPVDFIP